MSAPKTVSGHLKDLLKRDIAVTLDILEWLAPTQRDIDRRARPRRLANRYIAACMIAEAPKNPAVLDKLLDRTEGKVAEVIISGNFEDLVKALENGRARLLQPQPAIEGEIITPHLVVAPDQQHTEDQHPEPDPTESTTTK